MTGRKLLRRSPMEQRQSVRKRKRHKRPSTKALQVRILLVWLVFLGGISGLIARVYHLQIRDYANLSTLAKEQRKVTLRPYIPRRTIIDRNGNAVAVDNLVYSLYVHPNAFNLPSEKNQLDDTPSAARIDKYKYAAFHLAKELEDVTAEELEAKFREQESGILLTHNLEEGVAEEIRNLQLDGIDLTNRFSRFYPQKEIAAEIIGYVNFDHIGQAGIEYSQTAQIERDPVVLQLTRAGNGALLPTNLEAGLLQYDDWQLQLSLDLMLQRAAREALKKQMAVYKGKRGTVIIMDAHSGELLTLVTEPTYDPNRYFETDYELFKNWTVADLYEPGSTFKPINVAIALDAEVITPESTVYDEGQMGFGPHVIRNHDYQQKGGHGVIDIAGILRVSSNIGMIKIMQKMPAANFHTKLLELGLTRKTGIDLPGEATGQVADQERFTGIPVESATPAFGQSISLTPIKLVQLHAALANGGKLVTPHFVKGLRDSQGKWHYQPKLTEKPVFTEQTARSVLAMMETVVTDGSGKASQIAGYRIAGKTGTAQKVGPNGGYLPNAKITSFVSIFPVDQPKYVVLALIDEPQGPHTYGSTVAAPIVKEVLDALIVREEIPPSP